MNEQNIIEEQLVDYLSTYPKGEILEEGRSDFHDFKFVRNNKFGICLYLDDVLQSSSKDQRIYHSNMVSYALKYYPYPKHVLIIGGAGNGVLHHLLGHAGNTIKTVQIVDIDQKLFEIAPKYMYGWCNNELNDTRVKIDYENGVDFLKKTKDKYDIIFLDIGDPLEITKSYEMYEEGVYRDIIKALSNNGIMIYHNAPWETEGNIFHSYYENNSIIAPAEFHSKPVFLESFEGIWIFNVVQKMGLINLEFNDKKYYPDLYY